MNDRTMPIVPRRRRDEPVPAAPLDPYVTTFVQWVASQEKGVGLAGIDRQAASALGWPLPFAEAVVTAARSRRLLTLVQTTARGGYRAGLSKRGQEWLDRLDP